VSAHRDKSDGRTVFEGWRFVGDETVTATVWIFPLEGETDAEHQARAYASLDLLFDVFEAASLPDAGPMKYARNAPAYTPVPRWNQPRDPARVERLRKLLASEGGTS
jgi:hypothetical protein